MKKAYKVGDIPLWVSSVNNFISAFIHLFIMSIVMLHIAPQAFDAKIPARLVLYFLSLGNFIVVSLAIGRVLGLCAKSTSMLTMVSQWSHIVK
jgi:ABC-2 type transport system permease protein